MNKLHVKKIFTSMLYVGGRETRKVGKVEGVAAYGESRGRALHPTATGRVLTGSI